MDPEIEDDAPLSRPPIGAVIFSLLAVAAVIAVFVVRAAPSSSEVRVRNNTGYAFREVVINGEQYGNIDAGKSSEYRNLRVAYRYADVRLIAGSHEMHWTLDDYVGEVPLGLGKFTYVLNATDADRIDLSVEKESQ